LWTQWCALGGSSQASDGITAAQEGDYTTRRRRWTNSFLFCFFFSFSLGLPFSFHHRSHTDTIPV
jgi:catalase (peroxidase I)